MQPPGLVQGLDKSLLHKYLCSLEGWCSAWISTYCISTYAASRAGTGLGSQNKKLVGLATLLIPKPQTLNLKFQTLNPKPQARFWALA